MTLLLIMLLVAFFGAGYWCGRDQANFKHEIHNLCERFDRIVAAQREK